MRLRTFLVVFLVVGGLLAAAGVTSWALAAPPGRDLPTATVSVDAGQAWIQKGGAGEWLPVGADTPVTLGDHVKTGEKSAARIEFFDQATARLDEDSEVVVQDLAVDEDNATRQRVTFDVLAGRVWNRVAKFLDQDSSYTARMSDVVATVRGTSFVMDATDASGWFVRVTDSVVGVSLLGQEDEASLTAGNESWVSKTATSTAARRLQRRKIAERLLGERWYQDNRRFDEEFLSRVRTARQKELRARAGVLPGSPLYGLKYLGERLRLALVSDAEARRDLAIRYADRRFAEMLTLSATGRQAVATRLLGDFQRRYVRLLKEVEAKRLSAEQTERLCARLRGRFLEQERDIGQSGETTLTDVVGRVPKDAPDIGVPPREFLERVCGTPRRLPDFQRILPPTAQAATSSPAAATTSATDVIAPPGTTVPPAANTNTNVNTNTNTNTNVPVSASQPTKLAVTGQRTILYVPDSQQLRAVVTYGDGSTKDVTDQASWSSSDPAVLTAVGGSVYTQSTGSATVTAAYGGVSGIFSIRVIQAPVTSATLQSVSVTCTPGTIALYDRSACNALAAYSDDSTKDVTSAAAWSADPQLGTMVGGTFNASSYPGTAWIKATYTDGTTVSGTTNVTIQ